MSASASKTYRDETESVQGRVARLEEELALKERRVEELELQLSDHDAVFNRLKGVIDRKDEGRASATRWFVLGGAVVGLALAVGGATLFLKRATPTPTTQIEGVRAQAPTPLGPLEPLPIHPNEAMQAPAAVPPPPAPLEVCKRPGVHFTLGGGDAQALAQTDRDLAGHKYRRGGDRSPWFTVNGGPLYVHAVGGFLHGDVGTTELSLLTLMTQGDSAGYALAHGGKSFLEVQGSNGKLIYGRFEADVSRVADTTRPPPFGTPVERVRGTFCLPAMPANPSDTGP